MSFVYICSLSIYLNIYIIFFKILFVRPYFVLIDTLMGDFFMSFFIM